MKKDVENYCKACLYNRFKRLENAPAPLKSYPDVHMPFERVYMDLIGPIGNSEKGYKYCLVLIDVLTRYLIAEPIKTKTAIEVAKVYFESVVCKQGVPKTLVTDQGKEFVNEILKEVAKLFQMKHTITTPYHPQANGVIERSNGTVLNILRTLVQDNVSIWDTMLPIATFAYNTAFHRSLQDSPFFLMYLRDPCFPFEITKEEKTWYNIDDYKQEMASKASRVYARCQLYLEEAKGMLQKNQNKRAKIKIIEIGDRVYVKQVPRKGLPSKLQPAYNGPFRVLDKVSDVVMKVRNIRSGDIKTMHTDRVRVMHEGNITPHLNPTVKRAYPVHDNGETRETRISLQPVDPFPFFSEDTDDNSVDNTVDNSMGSA